MAVLGSLVTAQLGASFGGFAAAARPAWVVVIGCGLVVLALGVLSTTGRAQATARRTAERFAVPGGRARPDGGLTSPGGEETLAVSFREYRLVAEWAGRLVVAITR